jgi:predicted ABC-class ATPase
MRLLSDLNTVLHRMDGRGYNAYHDAKGVWAIDADTVLSIDWVQGDPYAAPSRVSVRVAPERANFATELLAGDARRTGLACHLARAFARAADDAPTVQGSGRSGELRMEDPGQVVGAQTAVMIEADGAIEARFRVGLPARGRRVLGEEAATLLCEIVPGLVEATLLAEAHDADGLRESALAQEDVLALRAALDRAGLVAFVADRASLPRQSGISDRPLEAPGVVRFESPDSLRVTLTAPNAGEVRGMGIPRGVTLIVGGGFHGKSTLLRAIEAGVYEHCPGDGRERVVADRAAVKIRAEDGRSVAAVDISPFIDGLPGGEDTRAFSTLNASGSTSQAASLAESLEAGARVLLVDEDTAATNFMIRDRRMQALVPSEGEPITPFVDRVRELHENHGVSTVLVIGGSGDYLDVADTVIRMDGYRAFDVTDDARRVAREHPTGRTPEPGPPLGERPGRVPLAASVDPRRGKRPVSIKVSDQDELLFGRSSIDLTAVEQIVSRAQLRAIGAALALARERFMDGERPVAEVLDRVDALIASEGLDTLDDRRIGEMAAFRRFELAAALNRLRTLVIGS